jgi:hypothetical protein
LKCAVIVGSEGRKMFIVSAEIPASEMRVAMWGAVRAGCMINFITGL